MNHQLGRYITEYIDCTFPTVAIGSFLDSTGSEDIITVTSQFRVDLEHKGSDQDEEKMGEESQSLSKSVMNSASTEASPARKR